MVKKNISFVKIWNHAIETTIYRWMFQVAGIYVYIYIYARFLCCIRNTGAFVPCQVIKKNNSPGESFLQATVQNIRGPFSGLILLMAEILHQLIDSFSHYL